MEAVQLIAVYVEVGDRLTDEETGQPGAAVVGITETPGPDALTMIELWAGGGDPYEEMPAVTLAENAPITVWREVGR